MKKFVRGYSALTTIIHMAADFQKHFQISPLRRCCKHYRERGGSSGFIKKLIIYQYRSGILRFWIVLV
ncbi:hypothetical protein [Methylobacter sp.]|uniref:hypothetical protein n=1 Tax=Methylobacter sp. TaxID=2051955 RepID=UPI002FDF3330